MKKITKNGKIDNLINKLLRKIGLMKISTAKSIGDELHLFYVKCVTDAVERDFGIPPVIEAEKVNDVKEWWNKCFDRLLKHNDSIYNITTTAIFDEYKTKEQIVKCRVCGCTDNKACPGGCYWVENDLCSQCKS
jgi:hypothetical protein